MTVANETIETPLLAADKQVKSYQYKWQDRCNIFTKSFTYRYSSFFPFINTSNKTVFNFICLLKQNSFLFLDIV